MGRLGKGPSRIVATSQYKPELQERMQHLSPARRGHREAGKGTESKKDGPKTERPWGEGQLQTLGWFALHIFHPWFSPIHPPLMPWASGSLRSVQPRQVSAERAHSSLSPQTAWGKQSIPWACCFDGISQVKMWGWGGRGKESADLEKSRLGSTSLLGVLGHENAHP